MRLSPARLAICGVLIALGGIGSAAWISLRTHVPQSDLFVRVEFRAPGLASLKADEILRQLLRRETTAQLVGQLPDSIREDALAFTLRRDLQLAAERAYQDDQVFAVMLGFEAPLPFDASTSALVLNHLAMESVLSLNGSARSDTKSAVTLMRFEPAVAPVAPLLSWSQFAVIVAVALSVAVGSALVALLRPIQRASTRQPLALAEHDSRAVLKPSEAQIPILGRIRRQK